MTTPTERPKPVLLPQFCKGCGRCIESCAKHCIELGTEINPETLVQKGLIPETLANSVLTAEDLGPKSLQEMTLTTKGQSLWQDGYARFQSGA